MDALAGGSSSSRFQCEWTHTVNQEAVRACLAEIEAGPAGPACELLKKETD
jgi:hypothetical protein